MFSSSRCNRGHPLLRKHDRKKLIILMWLVFSRYIQDLTEASVVRRGCRDCQPVSIPLSWKLRHKTKVLGCRHQVDLSHLCIDVCLGSNSSGEPERVGEPSLPFDVCGRKVSFVM